MEHCLHLFIEAFILLTFGVFVMAVIIHNPVNEVLLQ